jgi:hypothetical protein
MVKKMLVVLLGILVLAAGSASAQVVTGEAAPDFTLTDTKGVAHRLSGLKGRVVLLEWSNPDCPFVKKFYASKSIQQWQADYVSRGVVWLSINSSAAGKQGYYSPAELDGILVAAGFAGTAALLDPDGKVGRLYGAQTTPHIYVIDAQQKLVYQGAIDSKASVDAADIATATNYAAAALDAVLAGKPVTVQATKSYGCSVKY